MKIVRLRNFGAEAVGVRGSEAVESTTASAVLLHSNHNC